MSQKIGPFGGAIPKDWSYTFNPLEQINSKEKADTDYLEAQSAALDIQNQVITPEMSMEMRYPELYAKHGYEQPELPPQPVGGNPKGGSEEPPAA